MLTLAENDSDQQPKHLAWPINGRSTNPAIAIFESDFFVTNLLFDQVAQA